LGVDMPWFSLGTLTPTEDWQSYPVDVVNSETFKVIQHLTVDPLNYCWITQYFPMDGQTSFRRIYPNLEPRIITLPVPRDYRLQGAVVRTLQIKRKFPYYPAPWRIEIQVLY
jgi:hypothetical protein